MTRMQQRRRPITSPTSGAPLEEPAAICHPDKDHESPEVSSGGRKHGFPLSNVRTSSRWPQSQATSIFSHFIHTPYHGATLGASNSPLTKMGRRDECLTQALCNPTRAPRLLRFSTREARVFTAFGLAAWRCRGHRAAHRYHGLARNFPLTTPSSGHRGMCQDCSRSSGRGKAQLCTHTPTLRTAHETRSSLQGIIFSISLGFRCTLIRELLRLWCIFAGLHVPPIAVVYRHRHVLRFVHLSRDVQAKGPKGHESGEGHGGVGKVEGGLHRAIIHSNHTRSRPHGWAWRCSRR